MDNSALNLYITPLLSSFSIRSLKFEKMNFVGLYGNQATALLGDFNIARIYFSRNLWYRRLIYCFYALCFEILLLICVFSCCYVSEIIVLSCFVLFYWIIGSLKVFSIIMKLFSLLENNIFLSVKCWLLMFCVSLVNRNNK